MRVVSLAFVVALAFGLLVAAPASAETINLFESTTDSGIQLVQNISGGLDFEVTRHHVIITSLGVWDETATSGAGLLSDHTISIWDLSDTSSPVVSVELKAGTGTAYEGYIYVDLAEPLILDPGFQGSVVVAYPSNNQDKNANWHNGYGDSVPVFNGGDVISNIGSARYGLGTTDFPIYVDSGPSNRYHSGSFRYTVNPEPASLLLIGGAFLGIAVLRMKRRQRS